MLTRSTISLALLPAGAAIRGPCDLVSRTAASELLGQQVATATPSGPEPDEDSGGMRSICVYQSATRMLILVRIVFANAHAAREATTRELVSERFSDGDDDFTIKEEAGVGDAAFWAYSPSAAEFVVVKGVTVLALTLGGMPKEPSAYQAQLRAVTVKAATIP